MSRRIEQTPIDILNVEIGYYNNFIDFLMRKIEIDQNADDQAKIDSLINECKGKINQFNKAILILKDHEDKEN